MINATKLLNDLKALMRRLETDVRERCGDAPAINSRLAHEHSEAAQNGRTAQTFSAWRDEIITQAAAAWILACVFVRFMEDNGLTDAIFIAGPGERLDQARDIRTLYFKSAPRDSDREYLLHVFKKAAALPGVGALFDENSNRLWHVQPTGDGAAFLLEFFQKIDAQTGALIHDFTDPDWDTRFLGDLYQDLSENIRKKYALLQTPAFVEEFILDRTLTPAVDTFGLKEVRLIDPACGSGHFLLGAFHRILTLWQQQMPEINERELAQRALNAVYGVDINPQAAAIARFRLLTAALKASKIQKLKNAPGFEIHTAAGDSLLHGPKPGTTIKRQLFFDGLDPIGYVYKTEDADKLRRYLGQRYHAVVGNPPYITVKDKEVSKAYREKFGSCYRKYSLVCPFIERCFDLAFLSSDFVEAEAGYVGLIAANSFMKREFGKKLVEKYFKKWNLTHVIDTSGAYIPGHGTPTVILFGRNQKPFSDNIRVIMGIKAEPNVPLIPSKGKVWCSMLHQIDKEKSDSEFVSSADLLREQFYKHPWSISGGGATELKNIIVSNTENELNDFCDSIGFGAILGEDEVFGSPIHTIRNKNLKKFLRRPFIQGVFVRDWFLTYSTEGLFPYDSKLNLIEDTSIKWWLWNYRALLQQRNDFSGKSYKALGRNYWEYHQIPIERNLIQISITIASIATHNHFVLDRGGKVFKQTAPVIKLPSDANIENHLEILGLLNSSTALFWSRLTFFEKGGYASGKWENRLVWDNKLKQFPIPEQKPLAIAQKLDTLGNQITEYLPATFIKKLTPSQSLINDMHKRFRQTRELMIALQEELDWQCYNFYKITTAQLWLPNPDDAPRIRLGERAFEIVMARQMAAGELETAWFERHASVPVTEIPSHWPPAYQELVKSRIRLIESDKNIRLIEQPEYKRRWAAEAWDKQIKNALEQWLLNRLEYQLSGRDLMAETEPQPASEEPRLLSCALLADMLRGDNDFLQAAELYTARPGFDVTKLVETLTAKQAVPFLPVLRYKQSGLRKRRDWERTWEQQRQEDAIDARCQLPKDDPDYLNLDAAAELKQANMGDIPVPPKYKTKDFAKTTYWKLRGKLDVPKERFISYPGLEKETGKGLIITWAGWDHLQQAQALAAYLEDAKASGQSENRLIPMLAGLAELLPWLRQWHNKTDPAYGVGMGDFFADYVESEGRVLGKTVDDLKNWGPV